MTTWSEAHSRSEQHAFAAERALAAGDSDGARAQYLLAAEAEHDALDRIGDDKPRTLGITAVSAVALYSKAGEAAIARKVGARCLAHTLLPSFAARSLRKILSELPR